MTDKKPSRYPLTGSKPPVVLNKREIRELRAALYPALNAYTYVKNEFSTDDEREKIVALVEGPPYFEDTLSVSPATLSDIYLIFSGVCRRITQRDRLAIQLGRAMELPHPYDLMNKFLTVFGNSRLCQPDERRGR